MTQVLAFTDGLGVLVTAATEDDRGFTLTGGQFLRAGGLGRVLETLLRAATGGGGGAPEDGVDLGPPDLGPPPPDMGPADMGPPDMGPPDLGPPDMGPDLGPCPVGMTTCCGDGIVQANEECEPGLPSGNPDRCPPNPGSDCNQSGGTQGTMCIEGTNCLAPCVPANPLNPALFCPL